MSTSSDISNLFGKFGGHPEHYQELDNANRAQDSRARWSLLSAVPGIPEATHAGDDPDAQVYGDPAPHGQNVEVVPPRPRMAPLPERHPGPRAHPPVAPLTASEPPAAPAIAPAAPVVPMHAGPTPPVPVAPVTPPAAPATVASPHIPATPLAANVGSPAVAAGNGLQATFDRLAGLAPAAAPAASAPPSLFKRLLNP
ncbi:putative Fe-S oxidoreductase [plant metagenome]|uniref:Putative Fe-S oxidoreductase n=1 Tax=plant metagenome TaxID=1297885 RepID=A0A484RIM9_9ZZZZ